MLSVENITPYLARGRTIFVQPRNSSLSYVSEMVLGNIAKVVGYLLLDYSDLGGIDEVASQFVRPMFGGQEFIKGVSRYCLWIEDSDKDKANESPQLLERFLKVRESRLSSPKKATREWADRPYRFVEIRSIDY